MLQKFFKYHGAGNDFLLADNREGLLSLSPAQISRLCDRHTGFGADGVMLLEKSETKDFKMVFHNPDGSGGMMCGNGGRCIVAFAADLGAVSGNFPVEFEAPDGIHTAVILNTSKGPGTPGDANGRVIRLKMSDVSGITGYKEEDAFFLETGARHLVKFVTGLDDFPVRELGKSLRLDPRFAPEGVNVDFVEITGPAHHPILRIRTFEKGVEDETLACGTGIVASAVAACFKGVPFFGSGNGRASYEIAAAISTLSVDFNPGDNGAGDIWLTGPAVFIGTVECFL